MKYQCRICKKMEKVKTLQEQIKKELREAEVIARARESEENI